MKTSADIRGWIGADRRRAARTLRVWLLPLALVLALGAAGCCDEDDDDCGFCPDGRAPAVPHGLYSVTGDDEVTLYWSANTENDLDGYRIYRNTEPRGYFTKIASVGRHTVSYVDHRVDNGVTYYYAIAAVDESGNESDLSPEDVFDTPRPAGRDLRLNNARRNPERSGYDFSSFRPLDFSDEDADIYYWRSEEEGAWMVATERSEDEYTDIQDAGYLPLDQVDFAPAEGWSPTGDVPLIVGHTYVVWTWDNHFAKFRVVDLSPERVIVDWAYQTDRGNRELIWGGSTAESAGASVSHAAGGGLRVHRAGPKGR